MRTLPLTNCNLLTLVSDEDFDAASEFAWCVRGTPDLPYAVATSAANAHRSLHRLVASRMGIDGPTIDHINRDSLDNQRSNLRPATYAQNGWNAMRSHGVSGFPGVHRNRGSWAVRFDFQGAPVYFGTHRDLASARRIAAEHQLRLKGDFLPAETRALLVSVLEQKDLT